jgi:hypothetical protein
MTEYNPELMRSGKFAEATGIPQPGSPVFIALTRSILLSSLVLTNMDHSEAWCGS